MRMRRYHFTIRRLMIAVGVIAALIAYLLVRLAQLRAKTALSTQAAYRLIATALM